MEMPINGHVKYQISIFVTNNMHSCTYMEMCNMDITIYGYLILQISVYCFTKYKHLILHIHMQHTTYKRNLSLATGLLTLK